MVSDTWAFVDVPFAEAFRLQYERYFESNPRIGELLFIVAAPSAAARAVANAVGVLVVLTSAFVLAEGRLPSPFRLGDILRTVSLLAVIILLNSQPGVALFYIPHNANYIFGFGLTLLFLAMFRVGYDRNIRSATMTVPIILGGFLAGLSNEHTAPFFIAALTGWVAFLAATRVNRLRVWHVAGVASYTGGFYLLITAPGQTNRYGGRGADAFSASLDNMMVRAGRLLGHYFHSPVVAGLLLVAVIVTIAFHAHRRFPPESRGKLIMAAVMLTASFGMAAPLVFSPIIQPRTLLASQISLGAAFVACISLWPLKARSSIHLVSLTVVAAFLLLSFTEVSRFFSEYRARWMLVNLQKAEGCTHLQLPSYGLEYGPILMGEGASTDPRDWKNRAMASHWNVDTVVVHEDSVSPVQSYPCT